MGKQSKKGQQRPRHPQEHVHHKSGQGTHHHHQYHAGPLYKKYHSSSLSLSSQEGGSSQLNQIVEEEEQQKQQQEMVSSSHPPCEDNSNDVQNPSSSSSTPQSTAAETSTSPNPNRPPRYPDDNFNVEQEVMKVLCQPLTADEEEDDEEESTLFLSESDYQAKRDEILDCLSGVDNGGNTVDLWKLRSFALHSGGFLSPDLRKRAWPKLCGVHQQVFANRRNRSGSSSSSLSSSWAGNHNNTSSSDDDSHTSTASSIASLKEYEVQLRRDTSKTLWKVQEYTTLSQQHHQYESEKLEAAIEHHREQLSQNQQEKQQPGAAVSSLPTLIPNTPASTVSTNMSPLTLTSPPTTTPGHSNSTTTTSPMKSSVLFSPVTVSEQQRQQDNNNDDDDKCPECIEPPPDKASQACPECENTSVALTPNSPQSHPQQHQQQEEKEEEEIIFNIDIDPYTGFPATLPLAERNRRATRRERKILYNILHLFASGAIQSYYSGLQDIVALTLMNLASPSLTRLLLERLTTHHLACFCQDAARGDVSLGLNRLLPRVDRELYLFLERQGDDKSALVSICQEWVMTWFTQHVLDATLASRLLDLFVVSHPAMPLYLAVAMMTTHYEILLTNPKTNQAPPQMVLSCLTKCLSNVRDGGDKNCGGARMSRVQAQHRLEHVIQQATLYMQKIPPHELLDTQMQNVSYSGTLFCCSAPDWMSMSTVPTDFKLLQETQRFRSLQVQQDQELENSPVPDDDDNDAPETNVEPSRSRSVHFAPQSPKDYGHSSKRSSFFWLWILLFFLLGSLVMVGTVGPVRTDTLVREAVSFFYPADKEPQDNDTKAAGAARTIVIGESASRVSHHEKPSLDEARANSEHSDQEEGKAPSVNNFTTLNNKREGESDGEDERSVKTKDEPLQVGATVRGAFLSNAAMKMPSQTMQASSFLDSKQKADDAVWAVKPLVLRSWLDPADYKLMFSDSQLSPPATKDHQLMAGLRVPVDAPRIMKTMERRHPEARPGVLRKSPIEEQDPAPSVRPRGMTSDPVEPARTRGRKQLFLKPREVMAMHLDNSNPAMDGEELENLNLAMDGDFAGPARSRGRDQLFFRSREAMAMDLDNSNRRGSEVESGPVTVDVIAAMSLSKLPEEEDELDTVEFWGMKPLVLLHSLLDVHGLHSRKKPIPKKNLESEAPEFPKSPDSIWTTKPLVLRSWLDISDRIATLSPAGASLKKLEEDDLERTSTEPVAVEELVGGDEQASTEPVAVEELVGGDEQDSLIWTEPLVLRTWLNPSDRAVMFPPPQTVVKKSRGNLDGEAEMAADALQLSYPEVENKKDGEEQEEAMKETEEAVKEKQREEDKVQVDEQNDENVLVESNATGTEMEEKEPPVGHDNTTGTQKEETDQPPVDYENATNTEMEEMEQPPADHENAPGTEMDETEQPAAGGTEKEEPEQRPFDYEKNTMVKSNVTETQMEQPLVYTEKNAAVESNATDINIEETEQIPEIHQEKTETQHHAYHTRRWRRIHAHSDHGRRHSEPPTEWKVKPMVLRSSIAPSDYKMMFGDATHKTGDLPLRKAGLLMNTSSENNRTQKVDATIGTSNGRAVEHFTVPIDRISAVVHFLTSSHSNLKNASRAFPIQPPFRPFTDLDGVSSTDDSFCGNDTQCTQLRRGPLIVGSDGELELDLSNHRKVTPLDKAKDSDIDIETKGQKEEDGKRIKRRLIPKPLAKAAKAFASSSFPLSWA
eukprot:CAMPEP_0168742302 /NCGR_PEP_ID=MMETSP0724-20121128/12965_1 /TAXON_ID=265536 /ORGANISM="Amphiprora sp., Strain CCMP467" /LENGTH=1721 /DNA_ID=CAMNT_0008789845 /DNA_START=114 /DNA_END=5275 /DNA_ORIENTATION=+